MRQLFLFLLVASFLGLALKSNAQVCNGSLGAPVFNGDFGSGASEQGPPLAAGITTLHYVANACGAEDGEYAITNSMRSTSCKGGTWQSILHDHTYDATGDPNGYMMIINASQEPSTFFTQRVAGNKFCPNTTYEFSAYIMNILRDLPQTKGFTKPDITFNIRNAADNSILGTYDTKEIEPLAYPHWEKYSLYFTSPATETDIIIEMVNKGKGGDGNDLALDDITFSTCGPIIQTGFGTVGNVATQTSCLGKNINYTLMASQTGYPNPSYQWQQNINNAGWVNITGQTITSLPVTIDNAALGRYQYRIGVLSANQVGSENCRIYSDPLTLIVYDYPVVVLAKATSGCMGQPLYLGSTGGSGGTYEWTGPNGFTATGDSPLITANADKSFEGDYTVKVTVNGCPTFTTTTVTVYDAPTINPINSIYICEGTGQQLTASGTNITHYKWTPAAGLDHDDIANPIASPSSTTKYTVEVSNDGCAAVAPSTQVTVTVWKKPVANAGPTIKMFEGDIVKINASAQGDHIFYYWTPGVYMDNSAALTPNISPSQDITYTLHVVSDENCGESTSDVFVRVYKKLTIPNTFSPNGDNINDKWNITNINNYPNAEVTVFNRYGQQVFQSKGYGVPWNGTYNNTLLNAGTYYYVIDLKEDNLPPKTGWVFLVK